MRYHYIVAVKKALNKRSHRFQSKAQHRKALFSRYLESIEMVKREERNFQQPIALLLLSDRKYPQQVFS